MTALQSGSEAKNHVGIYGLSIREIGRVPRFLPKTRTRLGDPVINTLKDESGTECNGGPIT